MNYSLTKIRTFTGREGYGLNAVICKDGKPVAFVLDEAHGGDVEIDFTNPGQNGKSYEQHRANARTEEAAAHAFALDWLKNSPEAAENRALNAELNRPTGNFPGDTNSREGHDALVDWVNHTVDALQAKKSLDRIAKKKTLFRIDGETYAEGEYRTIKKPYDASVQQFLDTKYPGRVTEIYGVRA